MQTRARLVLILALLAIPLIAGGVYFVVFGNPFASEAVPTPWIAERPIESPEPSPTESVTPSPSGTPTPVAAGESVTVSGRVMYAYDDTAVTAATVRCHGRYLLTTPGPATQTGNDGRFLLEGCPPGELALAVEHASMTAPVYDLGKRSSGEHVRDVLIEADVGGRILGLVRDERGGIAGARVVLFARPADDQRSARIARHAREVLTTDSDGRFETSALGYGDWDVVAATADGRSGSTRVGVHGSTHLADVTLPNPLHITGRVYASEKGVEGVEVQMRSLLETASAPAPGPLEQRTIAAQLFGDIDASRTVVTTAKGRFEIGPLAPGEYHLSAMHTKLGAGALRVRGGDEDVYLELLPSGEILGSVESDGEPAAVVGLVTARSTEESLFEPHARLEKGLFRLSPVPEGDWRVRVYVSGRDDAPLPDRTVEVRAGTSTELHWDLSELEPPP